MHWPAADTRNRPQKGDALVCSNARQPADVVAGHAQHGLQSITLLTLEVTAIHAVIIVEVANNRFDGLAPFEQSSILLANPFGLAPVQDVRIRVIGVYPPVAQIDEGRRWFWLAVLNQDRGLLQLFVQRVPVVRVAMEGPGNDEKVAVQRAGDAYLHAEFVGRLDLAFANAVHLGRVEGVELALSVGSFALTALGHDAPGLVQGLTKHFAHGLPDDTGLGLDLALQAADDVALVPDSTAHALELEGVSVAPGFATQLVALFGKGLLQIDPSILGCFNQLQSRILQQAAVDGVGNRLEPYCAVYDHAGQLLRLDRLEFDRHVDGQR